MTVAEVEQQVLAPPADGGQRLADGVVGGGTAVLSAVNESGRNVSSVGAAEVVGEPLGVGLDLGELGHAGDRCRAGPHGGEARRRGRRARAVGEEPGQVAAERSRPAMNAAWADSSPSAMAPRRGLGPG